MTAGCVTRNPDVTRALFFFLSFSVVCAKIWWPPGLNRNKKKKKIPHAIVGNCTLSPPQEGSGETRAPGVSVDAMGSDLLALGASYGSKTDQEETPLHLAARHSRADAAKRLLDDGADANSRDGFNRTPLHLGIGADAPDVVKVIKKGILFDLSPSVPQIQFHCHSSKKCLRLDL